MTGSRILTPVAPTKSSALRRFASLTVPDAADLVLVGDFLAAGWPAVHLASAFPGLGVFNFGLPGDRIQTTLWRLDARDLSSLAPSHALLVLGTNNLSDGDDVESIADGLAIVLGRLASLWPAARLLVATIPSRHAHPLPCEPERRRLNGMLRGQGPTAARGQNHPPSHAKVPAEGRPRSTHDRSASFEGSLREAPQDEQVGWGAPRAEALAVLDAAALLDAYEDSFAEDGFHLSDLGYSRLTEGLRKLIDR